MTSPTQRSLKEISSRGWLCDQVERWIPRTKIRRDLFGMFDLLCLDGLPGVLGLQVTDDTSHSKRLVKMQSNPILANWLQAGNRAAVWSWGKRGPRGKRKTWTLRESFVDYADTDGGA